MCPLQVGPYGDVIRYSFDEPLVLIPECDGVRLLSNSLMEILQRVPDSIVSIFGVGSTAPAALLFEALEHFEKRRWAKFCLTCEFAAGEDGFRGAVNVAKWRSWHAYQRQRNEMELEWVCNVSAGLASYETIVL
jgi:hypothetical protein